MKSSTLVLFSLLILSFHANVNCMENKVVTVYNDNKTKKLVTFYYKPTYVVEAERYTQCAEMLLYNAETNKLMTTYSVENSFPLASTFLNDKTIINILFDLKDKKLSTYFIKNHPSKSTGYEDPRPKLIKYSLKNDERVLNQSGLHAVSKNMIKAITITKENGDNVILIIDKENNVKKSFIQEDKEYLLDFSSCGQYLVIKTNENSLSKALD